MSSQNQTNTPLYEKSQKEASGVTIRIRKEVYYYDLMKISGYHYTGGFLDFEQSGKRITVSGGIAKGLYSALNDWHNGEIP